MPTNQSENVTTIIANKVIEGAMAIPAQVKKFADSVLGQKEVKRSRKTATKPRVSAKPRRITATKR